MESKDLCEIALRVLKAWTYKELPDFSDLEILRCSCLPEEADLLIDELACGVIARECKKAIHYSQTERMALGSNVRPRKKAS
jgi:hypothetical protein